MGIQFRALDANEKPIYVDGYDMRDGEGFFNAYGWNEGNAQMMLALLDLPVRPWGQVSVRDCRRAVMLSMSLLDGKVPDFVHSIPPHVLVGDVWRKLRTFAAYVKAATEAGAQTIQWG